MSFGSLDTDPRLDAPILIADRIWRRRVVAPANQLGLADLRAELVHLQRLQLDLERDLAARLQGTPWRRVGDIVSWIAGGAGLVLLMLPDLLGMPFAVYSAVHAVFSWNRQIVDTAYINDARITRLLIADRVAEIERALVARGY